MFSCNDNNVIDLCRACNERAARGTEGLCSPCDADVYEHLSYLDDPEALCSMAGFDTDPRF